MMFDLLIRNGWVVDGSGSPGRIADIAIAGGLIAEMGAHISGAARDVIDADGALVTPGFVDMHTHYDGQVMWDDRLDPSFSNGVTTIVTGNCGVGFAPVRPLHRKKLIELMEGVEEIPEIVLETGLDWRWETFPDYLDRLEARHYTMDVAVQIAHAPLRVYVMGERALAHELATDDDIAEMARLVREAMLAGAVGVSGSRILEHRSSKGEAVPGTFAEERELLALARAMGECGAGTFQIVPLGMIGDTVMPEAGRDARLDEHGRIERIAKAAGRPVTYLMQEFMSDPEDWRLMIGASERANAAGLEIYPQIGARGVGMVSVLDGHHLFACRPSYRKIAHLPLSERVIEMRRAELRQSILQEADLAPGQEGVTARMAGLAQRFAAALPRSFLLGAALDYEPDAQVSIGSLAAVAGCTPEEVLYDHFAAGDGHGAAVDFVMNYAAGDLSAVREMLLHPNTVSGLGDGGAHMSSICDAALTTFQLSFWARDRVRGETIPLEFMVRKITRDNARLYGLTDRGELAIGKRADINIIDFARLSNELPQMHFDLPEGGKRLLQPGRGYLATIVNGVVTRKNDCDTGERPGRLVRAPAMSAQ